MLLFELDVLSYLNQHKHETRDKFFMHITLKQLWNQVTKLMKKKKTYETKICKWTVMKCAG